MRDEPIAGPLRGKARHRATEVLQATLVDLLALALMTKHAHWTVVGEMFDNVHRRLDEDHATLQRHADAVAERSAALGVAPDGRPVTVAEHGLATWRVPGFTAARSVVGWMVDALRTADDRLRQRLDDLGDADLVTQDVLLGVTRDIEHSLWIWQAQLV